jgi:hypothetical protein
MSSSDVRVDKQFFQDHRNGTFTAGLVLVDPIKTSTQEDEMVYPMLRAIRDNTHLRTEFLLYFIKKVKPDFANYLIGEFKDILKE